MDPDAYFDRVLRFLETNGWNTSPSKVNEETYLVTGTRKSETYYDRMLAMVIVTEETKLGPDHVEYLVDAAEEHEVDQAMVTCRAGPSEDAATLLAEHDVEFVETSTIDDAFVDGFDSNGQDSPIQSASVETDGDGAGQLVVTVDGGFLSLLLGLYLGFAVAVALGVGVGGILDERAIIAAAAPAALLVGSPVIGLLVGVQSTLSDASPSSGTIFAGAALGHLVCWFLVGVAVAAFDTTGDSGAYATVGALVATAGLSVVVGAVAAGGRVLGARALD